MYRSSIVSLLSSHVGLDARGAGLIGARTFRSITVTRHRIRTAPWSWSPEAAQRRHALVVFDLDLSPGTALEDANAEAVTAGWFLPPDAAQSVPLRQSSDAIGVWVPGSTLDDFAEGGIVRYSELRATALTAGFRAFAEAVIAHEDEGSSISNYAVERLLAEMTLAAVLEQQSVETSPRPSSLIERARSLMLVRREDPAFTAAQLAGELHISPRQLQRAFARLDITPSDMLRRMRVELAESMLRSALYAGLTIEDIARYSGFTTALQLRRALRAEGSASPSAQRRGAVQPN